MGSRRLSSTFSPIFVLVGPFADPKILREWAHSEFRKDAAVAFVGVDSGLDPLVASELPITLGIGDLDGDGKEMRYAQEFPIVELPRSKERSDLAFALDFCAAQKTRAVYAFGFQGGRFDHELAVHFDLSNASRKIPRVVSVGEKGAVVYVDAKYSPLVLDAKGVSALREVAAPKTRRSRGRSKLVSLFPVGGPAVGVTVRGLRFPVLNGILSLSSQGLSNEIRASKIEVGFRRGRLALFFPAHS